MTKLLKVSRSLLIISGLFAIAVLVFGFSRVHCTHNCGGIVHFQAFHYRNLFFAFIAVQSFGWFTFLENKEGSGRWNLAFSLVLILISAWVYGVVFQWDWLATFYFGKISPYMAKFFLL